MEVEMTTTAIESKQSIGKMVGAGALAGLGGGVLFGAMMGMMGMLPMVGMLIGQENSTIGFIVHLVISAILGAVYGAFAGRVSGGGANFVAGVIYGLIWWVLGALVMMPLMLGMNEMVFQIGQPQWMSLIGHVIYGVATAFLVPPISQRL
jgi:uncharacterized membrane protein YagU involved in acid resistance